MDAVKFLKEAYRMCYSFGLCRGCPFEDEVCIFDGFNEYPSDAYIEKIVYIVEKWSKENPFVTNMDKLKAVFGIGKEITLTEDWLNREYKKPE